MQGLGQGEAARDTNKPANSPNSTRSPPPGPTMQCGGGLSSNHGEGWKRPLHVSPTEVLHPKRVAVFSDGRSGVDGDAGGGLRSASPLSGLRFQAELSRSTPSLLDPPDRSKFWLELDSVYPENVSQSYESLQIMNGRNLQRNLLGEGKTQGALPVQDPLSQSATLEWMETHVTQHSEEEPDSPLPSPRRELLLSSDQEASGEESDPRPPPTGKAAVWIFKRHGQQPQQDLQDGTQVSAEGSPDREHWYGSEEFLALPAQLRKTEMLAMKLESLAQAIPLRPGLASDQDQFQDVDDWDLTELNPDWDLGESGDNVSNLGESGDSIPSPPPHPLSYKPKFLVGRFSPSSSSDIAPSLDDSIESGPLSDLLSEEEEGRSSRAAGRSPGAGLNSADHNLGEAGRARLQLTVPPVDGRGGAALVQQLLEDILQQDKDQDVWNKIECFVGQLDEFIGWLQEALESTENWKPPRHDLDSLRVYLETHLSFKLNVVSHSGLKERVMEEGRSLLSVITCHKSGLRDMLQMISSQWLQLQRQIRRQHGWMLCALHAIQARALGSQSREPALAPNGRLANQPAPCPVDSPKEEVLRCLVEAQRDALEQMALKLNSLHHLSATNRRHYSQLSKNNSLQEFEADYQELWDWLMDMDAVVTDSHQLMMSDEQRQHLYKGTYVELVMMQGQKASLLGWAESLRRSGTELPADFDQKIHTLTQRWTQLEKFLSEHSGSSGSQHPSLPNANSLLACDGGGDGGGEGGGVENPRAALSPLTNSMLGQLEGRIKELKSWLRDTELLIFNSCLRHDQDASAQLHSFKSLCLEVRGRRRGVSSVLKLCQKLLEQSQVGPLAEVGPEAEQHRATLQLLSINLERRWEAIVMQVLQWQNRLRRDLGSEQVPGNFLEPGLVDLRQSSSPVSFGPVAPDDSWEWDETDMTITEPELQDATPPDLTHNLPTEAGFGSDRVSTHAAHYNGIPGNGEVLSNRTGSDASRLRLGVQTSTAPSGQPTVSPRAIPPNNNNIYQVYSLHNVELYSQPPFPIYQRSSIASPLKPKTRKHQTLLKSLSKDSSFSSIESLPDLLGGLLLSGRGGGGGGGGGGGVVGYQDGDSGRGGSGSLVSSSSRRSESESGIVSDTEIQGEEGEEDEREGERKKREGKVTGTATGSPGEGRMCDEDIDRILERANNLALYGDPITVYNQRTKMGRKRKEENAGESRRREDRDGESRRKKDESRRKRDEKKVIEKRKKQRRGGEAVEIFINGRGILTPADSDSDLDAGVHRPQSPLQPFVTYDHGDIIEFKGRHHHGLETPPHLSQQPSPSSQGSSLESLLALGVQLFPSSRDVLQRSASLESCLAQCRSAGGETGGSLASLGEMGESGGLEAGEPSEPGPSGVPGAEGESSGELSHRTLELLTRLENIQSPLTPMMTRSVSDMTLRTCSLQARRLPASPSLGGQNAALSGVAGSFRRGPPSLINESSATASLTELSSTEDSSLGSEDLAALKNRRHLFLDPVAAMNANSCSFRKRCQGNSRGGLAGDEADATSVSMVVNVSCTSACTDDDEDDSDLLSSSTLTLTEEELGVREDGEEEEELGVREDGEEEEERLSGNSSVDEDDDDEDDEEEMEGSYVLGLEYMKRELQSWIRPSRASSCSSSSKTEVGLRDELQCGTTLDSSSASSSSTTSSFTSSSQSKEQRCFLSRSALKLLEAHTNNSNSNSQARSEQEEKENEEEDEENRRNATRSYISQFVDDVENGNVDQSQLRGKDEDDELLREESSLFTKKGVESFRESYAFAKTGESFRDASDPAADAESRMVSHASSPSSEFLPLQPQRASSLVGQLRGELPCHSSSLLSPSLSPVEDCGSHDALHSRTARDKVGGRQGITSQENFTFSSFVTEESRRETRNKQSSLASKKHHRSHSSSCCGHLPSASSLRPRGEEKKENVHDFVLEIIDMASVALRSKESGSDELSQDHGPSSLAHIRDKVLEHSHRPIHLRKGDFYSYLSLSSHDSDCGEVTQCSEDKSSTPAPYSLPSYSTPTQGLTSPCPSPVLFTSANQSYSTSTSSSPGLDSNRGTASPDERLFEGQARGRRGAPGSCSLVLSPSPDEEMLFEACTEEVYLGPPLCYSMVLTKKPRRCSPRLSPRGAASTRSSPASEGSNLNDVSLYFQGISPTPRRGESPRSPSPRLEPGADPIRPSRSPESAPTYLRGQTASNKPDSSDPLPFDGEERNSSDRRLRGDVARGEAATARSGSAAVERRRNEPPPYLNPPARVAKIDSPAAAECLADTKTLESNIGPVMTKISVCCSGTNPLKEPGATATRINPKINCPAMRAGDSGEGEEEAEERAERRRGGGEVDTQRARQEKGRRGRTGGSQQEAKAAAMKQVTKPPQAAVRQVTRTAQGRSQASERLPTSRTGMTKRLSGGIAGGLTSRLQL